MGQPIRTIVGSFDDVRRSLSQVDRELAKTRSGTVVLSSGSATVAEESVTDDSRVFVSRMDLSGTPGHLSVTVSAGVGFDIDSTSGSDASTVAWMLLDP